MTLVHDADGTLRDFEHEHFDTLEDRPWVQAVCATTGRPIGPPRAPHERFIAQCLVFDHERHHDHEAGLIELDPDEVDDRRQAWHGGGQRCRPQR